MKEQLESLGLTSTEADIYLILQEYQKLSVASMTKLTPIKRTTIYAATDELVKKGLVEIDDTTPQRSYMILPASKLVDHIIAQENNLKDKKKVAKEVQKKIAALPRSSYAPTPKVRIIPKRNIIEFLRNQTSVWEESMKKVGDTTWWGIQDHTFVEQPKYREWITWYWSRASNTFSLKLFSNDSEVEKEFQKKINPKRLIRFLDGADPISSTLWILGEYVISINTTDNNHYLIQTHDAVLAKNMRQTYRLLWKRTEA